MSWWRCTTSATTRSSAAGSSPTPGSTSSAAEYDEHFEEEHVERSTALHSRLRERGTYLCGPLARYSLNHAQLSPLALQCATDAGLGETCRDPFRSIIVRSVELVYACDEALRLIDGYEPPEPSAVPIEPVAGTGYGVSEAPRGMLYHRYRVDADGAILDAKIVPPTSQNQRAIEDDLRARRRPQPGARRRSAAGPVRADDPQLRPVHILRDPLPRPRGEPPMIAGRRVMVGLGNRFRGDDRAGLELADRLLARAPHGVQVIAIEGDPVPLLEIFAEAELVLVADAVSGGAEPGVICRFDASQEPVPGAVFGASTHAFGLAETIELARALGRLNARVIVYGICGADFGPTEDLTPTVEAALDSVAEQMLADLALPGLRPAGDKEETTHA